MLKLINIKKINNYLEANYIPEDSKELGYVKLNCDTMEEEHGIVQGYEMTYPRMAVNGLKRIIDSLNSKKDYNIPSEKIVMWY